MRNRPPIHALYSIRSRLAKPFFFFWTRHYSQKTDTKYGADSCLSLQRHLKIEDHGDRKSQHDEVCRHVNARLNYCVDVLVGAEAGIRRRCCTKRFHGNSNADFGDVEGDEKRDSSVCDPIHDLVYSKDSTVK